MSYHENVLAAIGHTPLVRLNKVVDPEGATVLAKLEFMNPGGSIKDRMAVHIIEKAEKAGLLRPGGTIVENTSGNTGVGLAIAAAVKGYRCIFTMPDKMSREKQETLKAFGAQVVVTPTNVPPDSPQSYYSVAKRIAADTPNSFYVNQYFNRDNIEAHYQLTAPGDLGADRREARRLRRRARHRRHDERLREVLQGEEPEAPERRRRPGRLGLPLDVQDREARASRTSTRSRGSARTCSAARWTSRSSTTSGRSPTPQSFAMARRLAREEGIFAGGSSGAAVHVAAAAREGAGQGQDDRGPAARHRPGLRLALLLRRVDARQRLPDRHRRRRDHRHRRRRARPAARQGDHRAEDRQGRGGGPAAQGPRHLADAGRGRRRPRHRHDPRVRPAPVPHRGEAPALRGRRAARPAAPGGRDARDAHHPAAPRSSTTTTWPS